MNYVKRIATAALIVAVSVAYVVPAVPVSAVTSSAALSITPRKSYTVKPGKTVRDTLVVRNLDRKTPLVLSMRVIDFTFTDDSGTPKLMLAEDAPQTTWSMKPFLTIPKKVTIPPSESRTLDMKVSIPNNQGAGSFYSAIVYSAGEADEGNVGLAASGVTLVFTQVPGKVNEDLTLEKLGAYVDNEYAFITAQEPEQIAYTLKNAGNVTEAPVGSITLKDIFGRERRINDVNPNKSLALIGQSRTFVSCVELEEAKVEFNGANTTTDQCVSPGLWPGYYSASLELFYGQNGNLTKDIKGFASFWYLPWWFVFVSLLALTIVGVYGWRLYNKIRTKLYGPRRKRKTPRRR